MAPEMNWVTIQKFALLSGYTVRAVQTKVDRNEHWIQGTHWTKAPDGRIFISIRQVELWIESGIRSNELV